MKDNGDLFVELPSKEVKEKLQPFLNDDAFVENSIVNVKSKIPSISIVGVKEFSTKKEFIEKIKRQNPKVKQLIDQGSEFSIIFSKDPKDSEKYDTFQIVARVSEDIRDILRKNNDFIYVDLSSYRVVDRFYIKRCNKCLKFGNYEKDYKNYLCCAYHRSNECQEVDGDDRKYECKNF